MDKGTKGAFDVISRAYITVMENLLEELEAMDWEAFIWLTEFDVSKNSDGSFKGVEMIYNNDTAFIDIKCTRILKDEDCIEETVKLLKADVEYEIRKRINEQ